MENSEERARVGIFLDKSSYTAGKQVNGVVLLEASSDIFSTSTVQILIEGHESCKFLKSLGEKKKIIQERTEITAQGEIHKHSHTLLKKSFEITNFESQFIPQGKYLIPFCFTLPTDLPGSYVFSRNNHLGGETGEISYSIHAFLSNPSTNIPIFFSEDKSFKVFSHLIENQGTWPVKVEKKEKTPCCCNCCSCLGSFSIAAFFEKSIYRSNECARITLELDNSSSKNDIKSIDTELWEIITLKTQSHFSKVMINHCKVSIPGLKRKEKCVGENSTKLQILMSASNGAPLQQTSQGKLISSEYFLKILPVFDTCQCCCLEPPLIHFPIQIRAQDESSQGGESTIPNRADAIMLEACIIPPFTIYEISPSIGQRAPQRERSTLALLSPSSTHFAIQEARPPVAAQLPPQPHQPTSATTLPDFTYINLDIR